MEKLERDGKVAVLYSPGYGAGWYTWGGDERMIFDPRIVQAVLDEDRKRAIEIVAEIDKNIYTGGAEDLAVQWIEKGTQFKINEYDGNESIEIIGPSSFFIA